VLGLAHGIADARAAGRSAGLHSASPVQSHAMRSTFAEGVGRALSTPTYLKVPELTVYFWIIKLLSTAMGESTSDYLVFQINPYLAVVLGCLGLLVALAIQLWMPRYVAWVYWLAVVMVAVFGTMAADVLHVVLGIPYVVTTLAFAVSLGLIFVAWYRSEGTLSIHSIDSPRRELFYWAAVIATFALGTAAGDMTAATLGFGYLLSASSSPSCLSSRQSAIGCSAGMTSPRSGRRMSSPDHWEPRSPTGSESPSLGGSASATKR